MWDVFPFGKYSNLTKDCDEAAGFDDYHDYHDYDDRNDYDDYDDHDDYDDYDDYDNNSPDCFVPITLL